MPTMPPACAARRKARRDGLDALAVEAEPVDHRLVGIEAKQARPRIARLRLRRHAAGLDEAEAEPEQRIDHFGILVEAGRKADRIGKLRPKAATPSFSSSGAGRGSGASFSARSASACACSGIEHAQQRRGEAVEQRDHGASSGNTCPFGPERQRLHPAHRGERQRAVEMREQRAAARGLIAQRGAERRGVDRDQHQVRRAGEMPRRRLAPPARRSRNG